MTDDKQTRLVLAILSIAFTMLTVVFAFDLIGKGVRPQQLPLVDKDFLKTETWRRSYANLVETKADLDAFDCYTCHEEGKKLKSGEFFGS
ncbi:MAG: hypothetical protein WCO57_14780 [Verrucomicrobiota bacterium]